MTATIAKPAPERRQRRKAETARTDIIAAAYQLFTERGYARTTTRDIAARAESSEVLLFRYFQNKANLFREAVVNPFGGFLRNFLETQSAPVGGEPFAGSQDFVNRLFGAASEHRDILLTLVSTRLYEAGASEQLVDGDGFKDYFQAAVERIEPEFHAMGVQPTIPPDISTRIAFTAILATAMFHDWIFASSNIDRRDVVVALNKFIISGMTGMPAPGNGSVDGG